MAYYAKTPPQPEEPRSPVTESRPGAINSFLGGLWEGVWRGGRKSYEQWLAEKRRKRRGYDPRKPNRTSRNWLQRLM